ncbi:FxsA family protein [Streptacidiphilus fuscans]|uniref:FxsA family protein n=1 Tax=Streptacidiphilus fuscans TaxID=2789292 RepID=A0A931BBY4_9ACTN|nr:FxsA family protein [Streptacidiphilus fuscans]MBF9068933.1 FxsA family protein [Streptacidiphilus fuscans]MBF9073387.1 FxsA family protein [Streptacidiphilus fuscans]
MRGSRIKRFLPLLVAAYALLELWIVVELAGVIGWLAVLALLAGGFVLGGWVIKRAGLRALRATTTGRMPDGEARTAVTIAGGVLLMVPGFLSDVVGLLCLVPPVAKALQRVPRALLRRGPLGDAVRYQEQVQEQMRIHQPDGKVVQGEVIHDDEPKSGPYDYGRRDDDGPYGQIRR